MTGRACGIASAKAFQYCGNLPARRPLASSRVRRHTYETKQENRMSVAKVIEITSLSEKSFEDAVLQGVKRASKTIDNIEGAWIKEQKLQIKDGKVIGFRVNMNLTFILDE
jgi:flavin-binding protein dodecin